MQILNEMIKMRDGVHLSTDIYLPDDIQGPYPVIIERTPYGKNKYSRSEITREGDRISRAEMAQAFLDHGVVTIFQDCRGRYESEGEFAKYINEAADGYDTIFWVYQQPWCNKQIFTMGLSYAAHTQLALLKELPPGLSGMILDSGGFYDAYQCGIRQGGAFEMKQATWAYRQALESPEALSNPDIKSALEEEDIFAWFKKTPWSRGNSPISVLPEYENYLLTQWNNEDFSDFWKKPVIYNVDLLGKLKDVPILFMSSWYDVYVSSTIANYEAVRATGNRHANLIMGPWLHGNRNQSYAGEVEFGEHAYFDNNLAKDWLSYRIDWVKSVLNHNDAKSSCQLFVMGGGSGQKDLNGRLVHGGHWITVPQWPLSNVRQLTLHLTKHMQLSVDPDQTETAITLISDPNHPVPTIGGALTSGAPIFFGGAYDQREKVGFFGSKGDDTPLNLRDDVLSFATEELTDDVLVCGKVEITIYLSSDCPDTDITAKLIDIYPPSDDYPEGFAMNITDGIKRARYRNSYEKPEVLQEGQVVKITVEPFQICNIFKKGHKIRLDISGSNFPKYDINPNVEMGCFGERRIAKNKLHISSQYPSRVSLEVV